MHLFSYLCSQRHISIREQPSCSNMTDQALTHLTIIQRDDTVYLTVTGTPLCQSLTVQFGTAAVACSTINRQHYRCRCLVPAIMAELVLPTLLLVPTCAYECVCWCYLPLNARHCIAVRARSYPLVLFFFNYRHLPL